MGTVKLDLNLASHPFGHTRLFWLFSVVLAVVAVAAAAGLLAVYFQNHDLSPELVSRESELRSRLQALQAEEGALRQKLEEPGNDRVLARSLFLNELLFRKGISWTRTFADLEAVLPPRVRMVQIRPEVTNDNKVLLEMYIGAETPQDFIEFLRVLESSESFGSPSVRGSSPPTETEPLFQYRLTVSYDQKL